MKEKGIEKESERETVESVRVRVGSIVVYGHHPIQVRLLLQARYLIRG